MRTKNELDAEHYFLDAMKGEKLPEAERTPGYLERTAVTVSKWQWLWTEYLKATSEEREECLSLAVKGMDMIAEGNTAGTALKNIARFLKKYKMDTYSPEYRHHCVSIYLWGVTTRRIDWGDVSDLRDWGFHGESSTVPYEGTRDKSKEVPNNIMRRADNREERMKSVERKVSETER